MSSLILYLMAITITASMNLSDFTVKNPIDKGPEITLEKQGIAIFLKDPSRYNFLCTNESRGEVLSASLRNDGTLHLTYSSFWSDGDHSGVVSGTYDRQNNIFNGSYKTHDGRFSGEINFSFNEKGEAFGSWDHGYGVIKISLKHDYDSK